jgi:hypothetical protein
MAAWKAAQVGTVAIRKRSRSGYPHSSPADSQSAYALAMQFSYKSHTVRRHELTRDLRDSEGGGNDLFGDGIVSICS